MKCPKCRRDVKKRIGQFGASWECCGLRSWSENRDMVDESTRSARRTAHRAFDTLWKTGRMLRREAYVKLAKELDIAESDCHMSLMNYETAKRVPRAVRKIICALRKERGKYKGRNKQIERLDSLD